MDVMEKGASQNECCSHTHGDGVGETGDGGHHGVCVATAGGSGFCARRFRCWFCAVDLQVHVGTLHFKGDVLRRVDSLGPELYETKIHGVGKVSGGGNDTE